MKKDQELSMLIGKRMTNRDTMFNEYLYEVLNAAQESGQRMGYAQGRDETAREILQEVVNAWNTGNLNQRELAYICTKNGIELEKNL